MTRVPPVLFLNSREYCRALRAYVNDLVAVVNSREPSRRFLLVETTGMTSEQVKKMKSIFEGQQRQLDLALAAASQARARIADLETQASGLREMLDAASKNADPEAEKEFEDFLQKNALLANPEAVPDRDAPAESHPSGPLVNQL